VTIWTARRAEARYGQLQSPWPRYRITDDAGIFSWLLAQAAQRLSRDRYSTQIGRRLLSGQRRTKGINGHRILVNQKKLHGRWRVTRRGDSGSRKVRHNGPE
jgi:hypothetical protein